MPVQFLLNNRLMLRIKKSRFSGFFYSLPSMALTLAGRRRCAPTLKNAPGIFLFGLLSLKRTLRASVALLRCSKTFQMFLYSPPSMAFTLKGQRFALFKNIPDVFVFAAIHGAHPKGPTLRIVQKHSRCFCIRRHPWRSP